MFVSTRRWKTAEVFKLCQSSSQHSAQSFQRLDDLVRPLCDFVFAQCPIIGLAHGPKQDRVLARWHIAAAENLCRSETAQFIDPELVYGLLYLLEGNAIGEDE